MYITVFIYCEKYGRHLEKKAKRSKHCTLCTC